MSGSRYVYIWEFRVDPSREAAFIAAYGPTGAWAELFRRADGYIETVLLRDLEVPGRFVTVDRWSSEADHAAFVAAFRPEYDALDRACEALTRHEASLGSYAEHTG